MAGYGQKIALLKQILRVIPDTRQNGFGKTDSPVFRRRQIKIDDFSKNSQGYNF